MATMKAIATIADHFGVNPGELLACVTAGKNSKNDSSLCLKRAQQCFSRQRKRRETKN